MQRGGYRKCTDSNFGEVTAMTTTVEDRLEEQLDDLLALWPDEPAPLPAPARTAAPVTGVTDGITECTLAHDTTAPTIARHIARTLLAAHDLPDPVIDSALLVTSELVTNAVEHALAPLTLHIHPEHTGGRVWIGVTDGGPATHDGAWTTSCTEDEHGRGRTVINALADTHGTHTHTNGHTTHWARIPTT